MLHAVDLCRIPGLAWTGRSKTLCKGRLNNKCQCKYGEYKQRLLAPNNHTSFPQRLCPPTYERVMVIAAEQQLHRHACSSLYPILADTPCFGKEVFVGKVVDKEIFVRGKEGTSHCKGDLLPGVFFQVDLSIDKYALLKSFGNMSIIEEDSSPFSMGKEISECIYACNRLCLHALMAKKKHAKIEQKRIMPRGRSRAELCSSC
jgi:hypothetical protein